MRKASWNDKLSRRIHDVDGIVFDKCSMGSARLLKLFHSITAVIRECDKPFGGVQVIAVGDFLQLKPQLKITLFRKLICME